MCWEKKRQCSGRLLCQSIPAAAGRAQARAFPMGCTLSRLPYISRGWVCAAVTACLSQRCRAGLLTTDRASSLEAHVDLRLLQI